MEQFVGAAAKKDENWVKIQRKTFTRWVNGHVMTRSKDLVIEELEPGLRTGVVLHNLLEIISGEKLKRCNDKARMQVQFIENINTCLEFIKRKGIKLVGIGAEDVCDGRSNLVLGLIWTLILRFQIVMDATDQEMGMSFRDGLLAWCNRVLNPQGIFVKNFTDSWQDGRAFCGLVNVLEPGFVDLAQRPPEKAKENMDFAFDTAEEKFEFPKLLDAVDVIEYPDDLSIMTYVSYYKHWLATRGAVAEFTYAEGDGLVGGESMTPAHFKIISMNKDNEMCPFGGANLFIKLLDNKNVPVCEVEIKDNLNGTYDCTYEATRPGTFNLQILIGRANIRDSPFHPVIQPGEPMPGKCTAEGDGLTKAVAGSPSAFVITARDATGAPIGKGGGHFSAVLKDATGGETPVEIIDNRDGTYNCSYTPTKASKTSELVVKLSTKGYGDGDIEGSSFIVAVSPGAASWENTTVMGSGTKGGQAGEPSPVTVTTFDSCGNRIPTGGLKDLTGSLSYEGGPPVAVAVVDNGNGTYSMDYTPEKAGTYLLDVKIGNNSVKDSPFTIKVGAGAFDPSCFEWSGLELDEEGRRIVRAGDTDKFSVQAKDSFGNQITSGGLAVSGTLTGGSPVQVHTADNGDGSYGLSYTPTVTGPYKLAVKVNGVPLGGAPNPCSVLVIPGDADGSHSVASGPGIVGAKVGEANPFEIQARDNFDNDVTFGGAKVTGTLQMPDGTTVPVTVEDNNNGTYSCSYPDVKKAGTYQLTPLLNGSPIAKAPFTIEVKPGDFNLENTEVEFPAEHVTDMAGPKIKVKDSELNLRRGGGDKITGEILPLDVVEVPAEDNGNGSFNVRYPGHFRGQYKMQIFVNGVDTGAEHVVDVKENPFSPKSAQGFAAVANKLSVESGDFLRGLLLNATDEERIAVLEELRSFV